MPPRKKVLLAMSGGVDSSVAAAILLEAGYEVVGCFMRLGSPGEAVDELTPSAEASCATSGIRIGHQGCCSINDAADARAVAAQLDISFYVCNFKREFGRIIDYFVGEYNAGRTPNPCVRCNDWLKFGKLHDYARQIDASFVASGHYARIGGVGTRLLRGVDYHKDQSYVLFGTPRRRLAEMLLPIGSMTKAQVRARAKQLGLPVFDKPDSQEICFVPDNDYAGLLRRRTPGAFRPGEIRGSSGELLGEHKGHQHFTVGQRRGLGISSSHPLYVIARDPHTNTVSVGPREVTAADGCTAAETNWLDEPHADWRPGSVKIRYNAEPVAAEFRAPGDDTLEVRFDQPQFAVAPGQAVVCYQGEQVVCGGWIRASCCNSRVVQ